MKIKSVSKMCIDIKILLLIVIFFTDFILSKNTPYGLTINNSAMVEYDVNGINYSISSNRDSFVVDRLIDIKLNLQNSKAVEVAANEKERVLVFSISNKGNCEDNVTLDYEHNSSSDFKVKNPKIFIDENNNSVFDENDSEFSGILTLNSDESKTLFIVADIPSSVKIKDKSIDGISAKSTSKESKGVDKKDKIDTVIRKGSDRDFGEYVVRDYWLKSKKSSIVISDDNKTHTGSIIRYEIDIKLGGNNKNKKIENVILKDEIPKGTKYINNSLTLNSKNLSDKKDGDEGYYDGKKVLVNVGTLKDRENKKITFDVIVK